MVLLDFPEVVKAYSPYFEDCFSERGFNHFQRLLSGFLVGSNHTIEGINRLFAHDVLNQSSANRFVNRQNFSLDKINNRRIEIMQSDSRTAICKEGCLSLDGSLLHHWGSKFDGISNMWDHVTKSYGPAHELVTLYYADDKVDYPLHYQLWDPPNWDTVAEHIRQLGLRINKEKWDKREEERQKWYTYMRGRYYTVEKNHKELQNTYRTKIHLAEALLRHHFKDPEVLKLPLAIDSGFASNRFCRVVSEEIKLDYVADLRAVQHIRRAGGKTMSLTDFVTELGQSHQAALSSNTAGDLVFKKVGYHYRSKKHTAYVYCGVHSFKSYDKKQKIIIHYNNEELKGQPKITITNRLNWYPSQILRIRRMRWPIETYHQEAKAQGLESYQVRNEQAIQSHIAFVIVAYTMLMKASRDEALMEQLRKRIETETDSTLPFTRRLLVSGAMWALAQHFYLAAQSGKSLEDVFEPIMNAIAYT